MKKQFAALALVLGLAAAFPSNTVLAQDRTTTSFSHPASTDAQSKPATEARAAADLDLDQLANMDVKVTSASKKEENLSGAPAAIYVITSEDIRRSGLSSVPELLRMVPGMTVQHTNSHSWTVSTRGFNGYPNEKMLVLIDGRPVYDPLYGGVYWDERDDLRLEDIDRIEVIRGPGGTLWGANAVNGVINIITKSSKQTQGLSMSTSSGHDEGYQGSIRFGGKIGEHLFYRLYGKSSYWDPFVSSSGAELFNGWNESSGGFRMDWEASDKDTLMIDGDGFSGHIRDIAVVANYDFNGIVNDPYSIRGGHILSRWNHTFSDKSKTELLSFCDWRDRTDIQNGGEFRNTCSFDLQHNYQINKRNLIIWGGGFRTTADQTRDAFRNHFNPLDRRLNFFSAFGQYEVSVAPDRLRIIGGAKFEHNTYTGFEMQPQVRAVWTPVKNHNVWGAVSRSVRTPTRHEHDNFLTAMTTFTGPPPAPPYIIGWIGNPNVHAEHQNAYELGYRYGYKQAFSFDAAAFYNSYTDLVFPDMLHPITLVYTNPPYVFRAWTFTNKERANSHGLEVSTKWRPIPRWLLSASLTEDRGTSRAMKSVSRHQFHVQSQLDLPRHFELDSDLFHVNAFSASTGVASLNIPTANRVDVGLTWRTVHGLSFSVWGRNVQSDHHVEGGNIFLSNGEVRRSVVVKVTWEFDPEKRHAK